MTPLKRPNPLTDELSDEVKAELAAMFSEMKRHGQLAVVVKRRPRQFWERTGW
jgi:hypothetical protein